VPLGIAALQTPLFASIPAGMSYSPTGYDKGAATGYVSLIQSIVDAASTQGQTYTAMYTSWPTNAPPVKVGSTQAWLSAPVTANAVIGWGYDWRQDNVLTTAVMLQNFLYNLTTAPGNTVDKITLIGHSMGGLVSRSYLESVAISATTKTAQDATILQMIDQLITLGTPHLGAPMALAPISQTLEIVKGLDGEIFFYILEDILGTPSPETITNLTAIIDGVVNGPGGSGVSTYQLLPPHAFIEAGGKNCPIHPYQSPNLPAKLITLLNSKGLQMSDLNAAIDFFKALKYDANPNPSILYQCIYGVVGADPKYWSANLPGVFKTTTGYTYTDVLLESKLTADRTDGGGDLVVPKDSARFDGNKSIPDSQRYEVPGADHIYMPSNVNIQNQVNALLKFAS
jgi:pimeloyl-ACP methyl ester carboxylesterase